MAPADAMLDLALDEDLQTVFRYVNKNRTWEEVVGSGQRHPAMIIGVSDGGAHLDRDDGSDWSTQFLAFWVREKKLWSSRRGDPPAHPGAGRAARLRGPGDAPARVLGRRVHLRPRHHLARVQEAGS